MTTISCDFRSAMGARSEGTVTVIATPDRPSDDGGWITEQPDHVKIVAGVAMLTNVAPGPTLIRAANAGGGWSEQWHVIVPGGDDVVKLSTLAEGQIDWPEPVVRAAQAARDAALAAAARAEAAAEGGGGAGIDDAAIAPDSTWSSTKIDELTQGLMIDSDTGDYLPFEIPSNQVAALAFQMALFAVGQANPRLKWSYPGPIRPGRERAAEQVIVGGATWSRQRITVGTGSATHSILAISYGVARDGTDIPGYVTAAELEPGQTEWTGNVDAPGGDREAAFLGWQFQCGDPAVSDITIHGWSNPR